MKQTLYILKQSLEHAKLSFNYWQRDAYDSIREMNRTSVLQKQSTKTRRVLSIHIGRDF